MDSTSPQKPRKAGVSKTLTKNHKEASTQTALNLEDLNTLLLAFLSPKQEACTQTDFSCDVSVMDNRCGRCEGDAVDDKAGTTDDTDDKADTEDKPDTINDKPGTDDKADTDLDTSITMENVQQQHDIVKQELTNNNDDSDAPNFDPLSTSFDEIELISTPKSHTAVKSERLTPTSMFSLVSSDRVTRSANRKSSTECDPKKTSLCRSSSKKTSIEIAIRKTSTENALEEAHMCQKEVRKTSIESASKTTPVCQSATSKTPIENSSEKAAVSKIAIKKTSNENVLDKTPIQQSRNRKTFIESSSEKTPVHQMITRKTSIKSSSEKTPVHQMITRNTPIESSSEKIPFHHMITRKTSSERTSKKMSVCQSSTEKTPTENASERTISRRSSARIDKRSENQALKDVQDGKLTAVVKLERVDNDDLEPFMCPECGQTFALASHLNRHAIEHSKDDEIFACDQCSDAFDTKRELLKHKNTKHRTNFFCDICSKRFLSSRGLVKHIRSHTTEKPYQCDTCDLAFGDEIELLDHTCVENTQTNTPKLKQPLHCIVCNKSFTGAYKLLRHYRSHTEEKPFQCTKCPRAFNNQYDLARHMKAHKPDGAPDTLVQTTVEYKEVCELCGKVLRCRAHLIRHQMTHTGERPFPCEHCNRRFTEPSGLKSHIARMHMTVEEKQHVCELCGKEFGIISHLNQHLKAHKKQKVKREKKPKPKPTCEVCGKTFTQSYKLNIHMHTHSGTKPFQCEECNKGFLHRHDYHRHMQTQHGLGNNEAFAKKYPCEKCSKVFNKAFHLKRHFMVRHSGIKNFHCSICNKRYAMEEDLRQHIKIHTEGPFPCSVCGKLVATQRNLQRHLLIHEERPNTKVFKCIECNIGFFSQTELDEHNRCHMEEKVCKCNFCEATFKIATDLKEHRRTIHSKMSFPINCEKCDKIFSTKYKIVCHMRTHEKPLICDLCGDRFSNSQVLRKHMITHTGIKPYVCEVCGKKFASPYHKKIHCRIHFEREFKCKLCNKGFTEKRSLEKHANVHLRPHQCLHCEKRFATIYHLQHHAARHTGNRPCKCLECNKTFIDMSDLNKHIKIHRKDRFACNKCKRYFNSDTGLELHMKTHRFDTRFACSICHRKFKLQSHMEKHERRHVTQTPTAMYSDPVYIESKVRTAASTCSLVKCCLCGKNYGLKDGDEPFICKVCEKMETGEQSVIILAMDQAIKMEREDDDNSMLPVGGEMTVVTENQIPVSEMYTEQELFKCTICEKTFMLLENFLSHCEEHPEIEVTIETLETK